MRDLEANLRATLRDRADDVTAAASVPDGLGLRVRRRRTRKIATVASAIGLLALLVGLAGFTTLADESATEIVPAGSQPPAEIVAVSDDGSVVVLSTKTGEKLRELVPAGEIAPNPDSFDVSPDGHWVYFSRTTSRDGCDEVMRVRSDGSSEPEVVASGSAPIVASRDGRWLAVSAEADCGVPSASAIDVVNLDTGATRRFTAEDERSLWPWSWDGAAGGFLVLRTVEPVPSLSAGGSGEPNELRVLDPETLRLEMLPDGSPVRRALVTEDGVALVGEPMKAGATQYRAIDAVDGSERWSFGELDGGFGGYPSASLSRSGRDLLVTHVPADEGVALAVPNLYRSGGDGFEEIASGILAARWLP